MAISAEFVNPFIEAAVAVADKVAGIKMRRGHLAARRQPDPSYGVCAASKPASRARLSARGSSGRWLAAACADGRASLKCPCPRLDTTARPLALVTADPCSRMCATP